MKNVMVLVHDDMEQEARLQVALDVVRALGGHLECLDVRDFPPLVFGPYAGGLEAWALAEIDRSQESLHRRLEQRLSAEDVPWSFGLSYRDLPSALTHGADLADLVVLSARLDEAGGVRPRAGSLPLQVRRPMLAVPPDARALDLQRCAVIAWDGSKAAIEAVRAALPILHHAGNVALVEIDPPAGAMPMEVIATYLSRHGIVPDLIERQRCETIAATLIDQVHALDAGLLVMGAYGNSRVAEAIFGGVTRTMLATTPVPLLMAH
ncbi:MAG: universal stress protein [Porphyrobacter sp.]|nr:universal stress protein [Porphyrobacter sp.]